MLSSKKLEDIRAILPLYAKGLISDEKAEEVEKFLFDENLLQRELKFWNGVKAGYDKIKKDFPEPRNNIYAKICTQIQERKRIKQSIWSLYSLNPKFSFGLIMFQFLLIIGLLFYIFNLKYEYKTLSTTEIRAETGYTINVIFKENAREKDIRELIKKIDGRIVDGPSKTGLYVIGIKEKDKKELALDILSKSDIVLFAENAY
jgi:hypothetical protein